MKKLILSIFSILTCSIQLTGQIDCFVNVNEDGYSSDWIKFFENGRFEFIHDEQCYAYTSEAGIYEEKGDSIQLTFFKPIHSKSEVSNNESADIKVDVNVYVYSLQDSSILNSATVFARDSSIQKFYLTEKVDSNGFMSFSLPQGKTMKYLRVYAENYLDCEIVFNENNQNDYTIKIYLSEDPLEKKDYKGEKFKKGVMIRKGKNQIFYNGNLYKRFKK